MFGLLSGLGWWLVHPPEQKPESTNVVTAADATSLRSARFALGLLALAQQKVPQRAGTAPITDFERSVAERARQFLLFRAPGFRDDCSGYASAVFSGSGVPMDGVVASLWELAERNGALHGDPVPRVGDLVFFDDTHDRNHNGRVDDPLTHVGVVIDVEPDGTAVFAHAGTSVGRTTGRINLERPWVNREASRRVVNSYLREPEAWDPPETMYLAGELWAGFATVDPKQDWL
jgi:hypothetical protein